MESVWFYTGYIFTAFYDSDLTALTLQNRLFLKDQDFIITICNLLSFFCPFFDTTLCPSPSFPLPPFLSPLFSFLLLYLTHLLLSPPPLRPSSHWVSAVAFMKTRHSIMFTSSLSELHQKPHTSSTAYIDLTISDMRPEGLMDDCTLKVCVCFGGGGVRD